jgi:CBS domain-containing protein
MLNIHDTIDKIMTKAVIQIQIDTPLREVVAIMKHEKIRHIPVVKGNQLIGIVSRTDINRLTFGALMQDQNEADEAILEMLNLSQVMSSNIRVVKDTETIANTASIFASEEFHALPVVDANDEMLCVGIVTTTDMIKFLLAEEN